VSAFEGGWQDIGHGHRIKFTSWSPDRELNPQYADVPDIERCGILDEHADLRALAVDYEPDDPIARHCGSVMFDLPEVRAVFGDRERPYWQVEFLDPLTISPSLLCICRDHGFIRNGLWVPA
jgi:hypothetical protein